MIDLFASNFSLNIDKKGNDSKKTFLGQVLTIIILLCSLAYLGYLIYEFWERLLPPTIATEVLLPNATLMTNRKNHRSYKHIYVIISRCDAELNKQGQRLQTPNLQKQGELQVGQYFSCYEHTVIDNLLKNPEMVVIKNDVFHELNHENGNLDEKDYQQTIYTDPDIIQHTISDIKIARTDIDKHPLWTEHKQTEYAHDFSVTKYFYDAKFVEQKFTSDIFKHALLINQLILSPQIQINTVVFEKVSEVLAKFFSLFNTLLVIGILGSMTSKAKILECTMDTYLKEYYNGTAVALYRENLKKKISKKNNKIDLNFSQQQEDEYIKSCIENEDLLKLNSFQSLYYNATSEKFSNQMELKAKLSSQEDQEPDNINTRDVYNRLFNEIQEAVGYRQLYKEILTLKSQVQLLMTESQYAASYYTVRNLCFTSHLEKKNHLERQDLILRNKEYREEKAQEFLRSAQYSQSPIDQNIKECIVEGIKTTLKKRNDTMEQELQTILDVKDLKKGSPSIATKKYSDNIYNTEI